MRIFHSVLQFRKCLLGHSCGLLNVSIQLACAAAVAAATALVGDLKEVIKINIFKSINSIYIIMIRENGNNLAIMVSEPKPNGQEEDEVDLSHLHEMVQFGNGGVLLLSKRCVQAINMSGAVGIVAKVAVPVIANVKLVHVKLGVPEKICIATHAVHR